MIMIKVKVCGMREPDNIREIASTGPDYMGFIFFPGSKRYVGENADTVFFNKVPARIKKVGVFVNEMPDRILELCYRYDLDIVQLHGSETVEDCRKIRSSGYQLIKVFGVDARFNFTTLAPYVQFCDYFMFDTKSEQYGGTGQKFSWDKIREYKYNVPFFLSGGIDTGDAETIRNMEHPAFFAVDINSRFETEPGIKNANRVKEFIKEIKKVN